MYYLLVKQFLRSKTVILSFAILILLGFLSIATGKQFINQKEAAVTKAISLQKAHIEKQTHLHKDDLGLLLYYLKFSFIKPLNPLAGISIGQSDINAHIQNVSILNVEGQKYDTDLVNPMRLQVGNLDLSFVIIFLFPLVIIALNFNLLSEEIEKGTWQMITIQTKSIFKFLLKKISVKILFVSTILMVLFAVAALILKIPFNYDFIQLIGVSFLYIIFWFSVCFFVVLLKKTSNTNAIILLTTWLVLIVFLPVLINNYITNKYPVAEAFTMTIKQRDEYHKRWDTDKNETMRKFYNHYPQFSKYKLQKEGFSWLWYYAMQQMGDDESLAERKEMYEKIKSREKLSRKIAQFFPPLQVQLSVNEIAKTSLTQQIDFLNATTKFHENMRLNFYPKIFDGVTTQSINWEKYKAEFYKSLGSTSLLKNTIPIIITIMVLLVFIFCKSFTLYKI